MYLICGNELGNQFELKIS